MASYEALLIMTNWNEQGCMHCRQQWMEGSPPPELAVNLELHARLHRCIVCGAYWEQNERYANVISEVEARQSYPAAFAISAHDDISNDH